MGLLDTMMLLKSEIIKMAPIKSKKQKVNYLFNVRTKNPRIQKQVVALGEEQWGWIQELDYK